LRIADCGLQKDEGRADLIHPPLFYALLKVWVAAGGDSLLWLRLFPALTSIAALVPLLLLAHELRLGTQATAFALLLAASNGYMIKYAQELRMYSLLLLLTLASLLVFAKLLDSARASRRLLLALFLSNLLLVYTHYYGWLVVACEAALLVYADRRKLRSFLLVCAGQRSN
jgi:mannosyltransferase